MDHHSYIVGAPLGRGSLPRVDAVRMSGVDLVDTAQLRPPCSQFVESARALLSPIDQRGF